MGSRTRTKIRFSNFLKWILFLYQKYCTSKIFRIRHPDFELPQLWVVAFPGFDFDPFMNDFRLNLASGAAAIGALFMGCTTGHT